MTLMGGDPNFIQNIENVISEMIQSKIEETDNQLRSEISPSRLC